MRKVPVLTLTEPIPGHVDGRAEPPFVGVEVRDSSALRRAEDDARDRGSRFVEVPRDRGPVQARDALFGTLPEPGPGGWSGRCHAFYNAEGTRFVRSACPDRSTSAAPPGRTAAPLADRTFRSRARCGRAGASSPPATAPAPRRSARRLRRETTGAG